MSTVTLINPTTKQAVEKIRVAAYCRVSSNSLDQQNSYVNQVRFYTDYITRKKEWELVEVFADEGITGTSTSKRPEFMRMIEACEQGQIDLIITKSVSRFARNVKETLEYVRKLKLLGVAVQFEKEGINTLSLGDEMLINTFSAIAQEESVSISQNLKLANRQRMANGEYINATAPYGYLFENKTLIPYEPEAEYVRAIFRWYLDGYSTREIAQELNRSQVPTKQGTNRWRASRVGKILGNEKYVGDTLYQKTFNTGVPFKKVKNRGEEDQYYADGTHIGIVDKETFDAVRSLLERRRSENERKTEITRYPLTGKIKCKDCESYYRRRVIRGRIRWACANHIEDRTFCDSHYISEERIYDGVITIINNLRFGGLNIIDQVEKNLEQAILVIKRQNCDVMKINREINELNAKLMILEQLRSKEYIAPEIYLQQSKEIINTTTNLKKKKQNLYKSKMDDELRKVQTLKKRLADIETPLVELDEQLFADTVISMQLSKANILTVTFLGGISFSERI